jgi:hypothetical protein
MNETGPEGAPARVENNSDTDVQTNGGRPQEKVEDRPSVGQVSPEDYPKDKREEAAGPR